MKINKNKACIFTFIIIFFTLIDQLTKILAVNNLKNQDGIELIKGVLHFEYVENIGSAFGMLGGMRTFFIILTIIIIPVMIAFICRIEKVISDLKEKNEDYTLKITKNTFIKYTILQYTFVFLITGAIGNFIDRLIRHYVVDFIYFKLIDFPVFNVADCYVTIATILLIIVMLLLSTDEFEYLFPGKNKKN